MLTDPSFSVFFHIPDITPERPAYMHAVVCLAEGLREMKVKIFSNRNYWKLDPVRDDYLLSYDPDVDQKDCSIVVVDSAWLTLNNDLPKDLFYSGRSYKTVYLAMKDGPLILRPDFHKFDYIFRAHYNKKFWYPPTVRSWAFGLSNRILMELRSPSPFSDRKQCLIVNFRDKNREVHGVRKYIRDNFIPKVQHTIPIDSTADTGKDKVDLNAYHALQCLQSSGRHFPAYYERLQQSMFVATFGGYFVPMFPRDESTIISRLIKRFINNHNIKTNQVLQWESWRFWESLAAGCVTLHLDFEKYGIAPPVMPENWKHYIGIDLDQIDEAIDRISSEPKLLEDISINGRQWALEHYSPVPTALRFLNEIGMPQK